jgi:hypothetical protein
MSSLDGQSTQMDIHHYRQQIMASSSIDGTFSGKFSWRSYFIGETINDQPASKMRGHLTVSRDRGI